MIFYDQEMEGCQQETIVLKRVELAPEVLTAEIPQQMEPMSGAFRDMFYPYDNRPEVILSDREGSAQLTFAMLDKDMLPGECGDAAEAVRSYTEEEYPHNWISPVVCFRGGEVPVCWFLMILTEEDRQRHHVKAVFSVWGRFCLATFTYPEQERTKWEAIVKRFFSTLHIEERKDETGAGY
jgi:hypothetical protein